MTNEAEFSIDVVGDVTGEKFKAVFKTKLRLSHRDYLKQDETRRAILGPTNGTEPSPLAANIAELVAFINAHLIAPVPELWKKGGSGLELEDGNVLGAVYDGIQKAIAASQQQLNADAEAAKSAIAAAK